MSTTQAWFVGQRGESLALMWLTGLPTLTVRRMDQDFGLDFLITIHSKKNGFGQIFGVEVKAAKSMDSLVTSKGEITPTIQKKIKLIASSVSFPVGVILVDITTEERKFGWIKAPRMGSTGPRLELVEKVVTTKASKEKLVEMVEEVTAWYDNTALN